MTGDLMVIYWGVTGDLLGFNQRQGFCDAACLPRPGSDQLAQFGR